MKRTIGILAGIATLGMGAGLGGFSWAQNNNQTETQRPALQSKIVVINLGQVIKKYQKYQAFENDLKQRSQKLTSDLDYKKAQAVQMQKEMEKPENAGGKREQIERDIRKLQREMQDSVDEAKQQITKQEFDQLVLTYKEVKEAVEVFARTYAIEMVLQYTDAEGLEIYTPNNFQHKLVNRACMPIYMDNRMDISDPIVTMLNQRLQANARPAAPGN